jgi:hypothetical protein
MPNPVKIILKISVITNNGQRGYRWSSLMRGGRRACWKEGVLMQPLVHASAPSTWPHSTSVWVSYLLLIYLSLRLFLRLLAHLVDPSCLGRGLPWAARCVEGEGATMGMGRRRLTTRQLEWKEECDGRGSQEAPTTMRIGEGERQRRQKG